MKVFFFRLHLEMCLFKGVRNFRVTDVKYFFSLGLLLWRQHQQIRGCLPAGSGEQKERPVDQTGVQSHSSHHRSRGRKRLHPQLQNVPQPPQKTQGKSLPISVSVTLSNKNGWCMIQTSEFRLEIFDTNITATGKNEIKQRIRLPCGSFLLDLWSSH